MADTDTSIDDKELDQELDEEETDDLNSEDDNQEDDEQDEEENDDESEEEDDDSEEDSEDDDESEDEEEDDEEDSDFKKAFSNIKGDSPLEYIPNLEDAYKKSTTEGKRLSGQVKEIQERMDKITAAVANNPELKKAIEEATGEKSVAPTVDPALMKARQDYDDKVASDLESFMKLHPDLEGDEDLANEFFENVATVGAAARAKGRIEDPMKAFKKAWGMLDRDEEESNKEKVRDAAKKQAAKSKSAASKKGKKTNTVTITDEQIAMGKKMGLTKEQLLAQYKNK